MAEKILFEIVTPERLAFSEEVDEVAIPGLLGEFGVLPGHVPFFSSLQIGEVIARKNGEVMHFAISGGFAEVHEDHVIVLAETAERAEEIDIDRALASRQRAEEALRKVKDYGELEFKRAELRLKRALTRESVSKKKG